jgi:hypothetical protein
MERYGAVWDIDLFRSGGGAGAKDGARERGQDILQCERRFGPHFAT